MIADKVVEITTNDGKFIIRELPELVKGKKSALEIWMKQIKMLHPDSTIKIITRDSIEESGEQITNIYIDEWMNSQEELEETASVYKDMCNKV